VPCPHTAKNKKMLWHRTGELCFTCHAKTKERKESKNAHMPFEQDMCHIPVIIHGSNFQNMLKDRMNTVCYSCHSARNEICQELYPISRDKCSSATHAINPTVPTFRRS